MIKIFVILILVFLLISWSVKAFFRHLTSKFFERVNDQVRDQERERNRSGRNEGDIHIETNRKHEKVVDKNMGEYVDYEEIK